MRILAVGSMYPPHHLGGYELMWRSAMAELRSRGHDVRILATDHREERIDSAFEEEDDVHRSLRWYWREHKFPAMSIRERLALEREITATFLEPEVTSDPNRALN
jgi:glycogen synthase